MGGGIGRPRATTASLAPADLVLKAACERCGAASELYLTSCRHTTLCSDCGKTLARARGRCTVCNAPVTRLIREFDVRVDTSAEKEKTHSIGRFTTGLPPFSKERSTENRWTLRKDVPQGRQLTGNMRDRHYSKRPWILEDETGEHQYQGQTEDPPATYYSLTLKGNDMIAVQVGPWYNFSKIAQYKQLTLEEAEEKMNRRRSSASGYERWMMKAATNGAAAFSSGVNRLDVNRGATNGVHPKKGDRNENGSQSDKVDDEEGGAARKNRLGLTMKGMDEDDEEGGKDIDFDLDDEIEKGDDWEHEETFTDDDEAVDVDIEERPDLADPEAPPPEIKQDDNENELGGSDNLSKSGQELKKLLRRAAGENESDVDDKSTDVIITILLRTRIFFHRRWDTLANLITNLCICFVQQEDDLPSPELAPKQLVPKSEPVDSNPAKPTPSVHTQSATPTSKSTQKRKSGGGDANTSNGATSKKIKIEPETRTLVVKDEKLSSLEPISKSSLSERRESSPITEEEVRAVLLAIQPTTCQDLVSRFKPRLITREDKKTFTDIVRKISHKDCFGYVVLRKEQK
ncbi:transcription initiation factor IIF subunit alpha isoform X1 [Sorghum bicolor]|uniref:transcription initiation factor IIF subunit alpha isoform X1 n=1 Tax=Sorghum bicolor TaxID=4558 RepID=UPI000B424DD3|nr:transcription initiation factor IIF subunit alpha isoform X1 [Sorghum bicolor]|eukprot:XP_021313246.1 transcription initiation factor IIF subunit alpha isoform X1 [Sorghum bicolor]